jgi:hypothetical protein
MTPSPTWLQMQLVQTRSELPMGRVGATMTMKTLERPG